jgi:aminoglycoside 2'-N-acetyltransferase I
MTVHTMATALLDAGFARELREMLDVAFEGDFADSDWEHSLGGIRIWATGEQGRLLSQASVVPRTLKIDGVEVHTGYVEAVATVEEFRGQGYGTAVMRRAAEIIHEQFDIGALSTGEHGFYERLGWERWLGPTYAETPEGCAKVRTEDEDGGILILRSMRSGAWQGSSLEGEIVADWRAGDIW